MDKDRIAGTAEDFAGKAEAAVGKMTGDPGTEASGRLREAAGAAQDLYGQAKDKTREAADSASTYVKQAYENGGDALLQKIIGVLKNFFRRLAIGERPLRCAQRRGGKQQRHCHEARSKHR